MRILLLAAFLSIQAQASDLPPAYEVKSALAHAPAVKEQAAGIDLQRSNDARLKAGPYEYTVQMTGDRRRDDSIRQTLNEWSLQVSRPFRLPGKKALDEDIGRQDMITARLAHGDAMHESAKRLLGLWFAWLREKSREMAWQNQAGLLEKQMGVVEKRLQAGDAPKLDLTLAKAAFDQARFSELQAKMNETIAARRLSLNFPEISLPDNPALSEPTPLAEPEKFWREKIISQNHAILLASSEQKRAELQASRSRANNVPDPTIGLNYSSEYGGSQRVVGGILSFPLPGDYRKAGADGAAAAAEMAMQRELDARRRVESDVSSNYIMAEASYNEWEKSLDAAKGMVRNADLVSSAYALGEVNLAELLAARRLAIESQLASQLAQIDALDARYRLMIDAHMLWDFDENTRQK